MGNIWERFNSIANAEEVAVEKEKTISFDPLPSGEYKITIEELEPTESKSGLPMLKCKMRTDSNRVIFYNMMLQNLSDPKYTAMNIAIAVEFIGKILGQEVEYTNMSEFADTIGTVPTNDGTQFRVNLSYGKNDFEMKFPKIRILGKVEATDSFMDIPDSDIDELPFN